MRQHSEHLEGWRKSRPVRIGNAAELQFQSDVYGLLLELSWQWSERGNSPAPHYWGFLVELVEAAIEKWTLPDRGFWEIRSAPRHFVHSKVMCWAAVDHGIALARRHRLKAPLKRWSEARNEIDAYVDYSGTIWANVMRRTSAPSRQALLHEMNQWLRREHGVVLLGALGFENAYALAMRRARAQELGIRSMTDLARHASRLRIGGDFEFFAATGRPEAGDPAI